MALSVETRAKRFRKTRWYKDAKPHIDALAESKTLRGTKELIWGLGHKDPHVALECIHKLGEIRDPIAIKPLCEMLKNEYQPIVQEAAIALGNIGDLRAGKALMKYGFNSEDEPVRNCSIAALGKIGNKKALNKLLKIKLAEQPEVIAKTIVEALGNLGGSKAKWKLIHEGLQHDEEQVARKSIFALGKIDDPKSIKHIIKATSERDLWGYDEAVDRTLVNFGKEGVPYLIEHGLTSDENETPETTQNILYNIGDKAIPNLIKHGLDHRMKYVKIQCLRIIGNIASKKAVDALIKRGLKQKNVDVKCIAIEALANTKNKRALPHLMMLTADENNRVKGAAKNAIKKIQEREEEK